MWLTIVLEQHLLPGSNVKIRFNAPSPGFAFQQRECITSRREFLWKNFYSAWIKFSPRMLSRFTSRQDSRRDPGEEFFSWRDPGEYRFLGGILAEIRGGNFSREGSRRENGPLRRDPGGIPVSAGNLGGIPAGSRYPFYKGKQATQLRQNYTTSQTTKTKPQALLKHFSDIFPEKYYFSTEKEIREFVLLRFLA